MSKQTTSTMPTTKQICEYAVCPPAFRYHLMQRIGGKLVLFGDVQADFQRLAFAEMDPSIMALAKGETPEKQRFWWERTKKASKDTDLAMQLIWVLCFSPIDLQCQVGAGDQEQANEVRKRIIRIFRANPWLHQLLDIHNNVIRNTKTGAECKILSSDTYSAHGPIPDWLIVNELSHIDNQEFVENLLDNAAGVPHGLVTIATNAGHLNTWQHKFREMARTSDRWVFSAYSQPAPWIDPAELAERQKTTSASRYLRLWWGIWGLAIDGALDPATVMACVTLDGPMYSYVSELHPFIGALDLGTRRDHSALVVTGCDVEKQISRLAWCQSWKPPGAGRELNMPTVRREAISVVQRFELEALLYDPAEGGVAMAQDIRAATGVHTIAVKFSSSEYRELMARTLLEVFSDRRIELYDDPELVRDLLKLQIKEGATGGFRLTAVRDDEGHADRGIALSMLLPYSVGWGRQILESRNDPPIEEFVYT